MTPAVFILMIVVAVMPPGILVYAPRSEFKSMTECLDAAIKMGPGSRAVCAAMPPPGAPA